jgi:aminoacylase
LRGFPHCGQPGHAAMLLKNNAGGKLRKLLDRIIDFRTTQVNRLDDNPKLSLGDVTSMNLTVIEGGVQANVIPPEFKVTIDTRLSLDIDHGEFEAMLRRCIESRVGIDLTFLVKEPKIQATKIVDKNPYWVAFKSAVDEL